MQTLEANERAADLLWLAYLLTGRREPSVDVTLDAMAGEDLDSEEGAGSFFSTWMLAWSRKVVIGKALAAIRDELAASARLTGWKRYGKSAIPPRSWVIDRNTSKIQLERALLALDVFPRCVLVLSIFEGMSLEDAAILLDSGLELVRKARMGGLRELTRNLARMQGWKSAPAGPFVMTSGMQHA